MRRHRSSGTGGAGRLQSAVVLLLVLLFPCLSLQADEPPLKGDRRARFERALQLEKEARAVLQNDAGRLSEAEALASRALDLKRRSVGERHVSFGTGCQLLASIYEARADGRARLHYVDPALRLHAQALAAFHSDPAGLPAAESRIATGRLLMVVYRAQEAADAYEQALRILEGQAQPDDARIAQVLGAQIDALDCGTRALANCARRWALAPRARALRERVIAAGAPDRLRARAVQLVGKSLAASLEHEAEATRALEAAVELTRKAFGPQAYETGRALLDLGRHRWDCGDFASALPILRSGQAVLAAKWHVYQLDPARPYWVYVVSNAKGFGARADKELAWLHRDDLPAWLESRGEVGRAYWESNARPLFFATSAAACVARARAEKGAQAPEVAEALHLEAVVRAAAGDNDTAAERFREALEIRRQHKRGKHDAGVADAARDLGLILYGAQRHAEAVPVLQTALDHYGPRRGLADASVLLALLLQGQCAVRSANLELAGRVVDRFLTALREDAALQAFLDADREFQGDVARSAYTTCAALGRTADVAYLRARFDPTMLSALDAPFLALREEGRYREVLERLRSTPAEVAELDVPVGDYVLSMSPGLRTAAVRIRVAGALQDLGRYEEAFATVDEALHGLDAVPHHLASYPHCLHAEMRACGQLASSLLHRGLVSEARAIAARAHALELLIPVWLPRSLAPSGTYYRPDGKRVLPAWRPPEHRVRATLHEGRIAQVYARCLEAAGESEAALTVLAEAVEHMRTHFGPKHPRRAELLQELSAAQLRAGAAEKARAAVTEAIAIVEATLGAEHPQAADMRLTLGDIHLLQGRFGDAIAAYRRSLSITEATLFDTHMNHIRARSGIALAHARDGRPQNALMPMREAVTRLVRRIEVDARGASNPDRLALVGATHWVLANWIDVSRRAGIDGYEQVLTLRGIAARSLAHERRAFREAPEKAKPVFEALLTAQRKLARLMHAHPWARWQRLAWRREIATQAAACDALLRKLNKLARKATDRRRLAVKPKAVRARLRKDEALVDILRAGGTYTAWVLSKAAVPRRVELGDAKAIDEAVAGFRDALYEAEGPDDRPYLVAGARLRDLLWAPIAAALPAEATTLYVVPDGTVSAVPLGAMPAVDGRGIVAERHLLAYLPYPQALLPHGGTRVRGKGLVVLGAVDYNEARGEAEQARPVLTGRALADLPNGIPRFRALEASGPEATWVEAAVRRSSRRGATTHLQGPEATEGRLRRHVPGRGIVHLATHGYVRRNVDGAPDVPQGEVFRLQPGLELHAHRFDPFLMSGLVLAGANVRIREGEDDGILTALEAAQLDLRAAELVVLSACQSAEGIAQAGEGSIGLVRGFTLAGARNVVGSLWKVEDEATGILMKQFYGRYLKNKTTSAAAALRESRLALRRGDHGEDGRRPVNWAAFVAYGPLR